MPELAKAYVQIIPTTQGIQGELEDLLGNEASDAGESAGGKFSSKFGLVLKTTGAVAAAGFGIAAGAAGELVKQVSGVAAYGDNIDKMSQKLGMSATAYQEWAAVMEHSGTSIDAMQSSMKTLANAVENGNEAFDRLGISQEQLAGMNNEEIFAATITALQNVDNETERTYLAGQLLGRGATELGALLNTSAEETQAMRDRVHELGGVMSDEAVKNAAAFQDTLQDLKTSIGGVSRGLLTTFLPSVTQIMDGLTTLFSGGDGIQMIKDDRQHPAIRQQRNRHRDRPVDCRGRKRALHHHRDGGRSDHQPAAAAPRGRTDRDQPHFRHHPIPASAPA